MKNPHIEWAVSALNDLEYRLEPTKPKIILDTAWSEVCRLVYRD